MLRLKTTKFEFQKEELSDNEDFMNLKDLKITDTNMEIEEK